jgi:cytochrome c nitrite reductase small subunit
MNCHVMRHHFDAWNRSSHKAAAACNSCHTPKNLIGKYAVKGLNGWNHGSAFTTGRFPEPFRIKPLNKKVVLDNCIRCHETMVHEMRARSGDERPDCTTCHRDVGHDD